MLIIANPGKFPPGRLVATSNALSAISFSEITAAFNRHLNCDWGDVCQEDRQENDRALKSGDRLVSVYHSLQGEKFWIITEADRSVTTVLLPEDY